MRILFFCMFLSLSLFATETFARLLPDPETRGVWVPAGYSPSDSAGIDSLMRNLSAANFNTVYVGVWDGHSRQAGTIYPSKMV